jgi:nicotinate phosphoribosyltransferase
VLAGKVFGVPVSGTHAHSWVMSFPSELEAFRTFVRLYPERSVLLVDTYDTIESGVPNAITVFKEMQADGHDVRPSIRLDSGDLAKLSKIAHGMMTEAGLHDPLIVASNDLEEDLIADLKRQGAKINAWGVGTHLITSHDCPALSGVYKLVATHENGAWRPRIKISSNLDKATDPGRKELIRYVDSKGQPVGDVMYADDESWQAEGPVMGRDRRNPNLSEQLGRIGQGHALLETVYEEGKRTAAPTSIVAIRQRALDQIDAMPEEFRRLRNPQVYRVMLSEAIGDIKAGMILNPGG